jgi:hypothetical protein
VRNDIRISLAPRRLAITLLFGALVFGMSPGDSLAQCILANPSFEVAGSGGAHFGGWNQFGSIGTSTDATHGSVAARVSGPNLGGWDVSGYWQRLDSAPGDQWSASVAVKHLSSKPLTGESVAILNIEWRDSGGGLISYESYPVADAATPADMVVDFSVTSGAAPVGTAAVHFLLGVLQSPTDPSPDVVYDQSTFQNLGPPSPDDLQWGDFPGGRTINFGDRSWRVKGPGYYGPGPNSFCDDANCTWVDQDGRLHMTVQNISSIWYSTEVVLEESLGYGDYIFTLYGRVDDLHPNVVLGLFIWEYGPCFEPQNGWWNPYNEIDVEFSRWGDPERDIAQFVAQPFDWPGNINRFDATFADEEITSHAFKWLPDRVEYRSWRGGPEEESTSVSIHSWTYTGPHIPRPEQPRVHINLWQFSGSPDVDQEVVFDDFTFVPEGGNQVGVPGSPEPRVAVLSRAFPNPFRTGTTVRYSMMEPGPVEIAIHDLTGRLVRTLEQGFREGGDHEAHWDGRDTSGRRVASGVYLYQLRAGTTVETRRIVLLN